MHLNQRVVNIYNSTARISRQEHYGSDGNLAYTLTWDYDKHGNIVTETDAEGNAIYRYFDANNNCVYEEGPRKGCHKDFTYDAMNRLVRADEVHSDGIQRTTHHKYDVASNKIATIDPNGNETRYEYDELKRVTRIIYPAVADENGAMINPEISKQYNCMGCVSTTVDPKGNASTMTHTIRGQPVDVFYADGSTEKTVYNLNGTVREKTQKNGTRTMFTYDPLGRILKTDVMSANGEYIKTYSATYSGFNILTETDPMGVVTTYTYYPNGLLKDKTIGSKISHYEYDTLGRVNKLQEFYGDRACDSYICTYSYNLLGQVLEETCTGFDGVEHTRKSYAYDAVGNIIRLSTYTQNGECKTTSLFDTHNVPVLVTDPEGDATKTICRYNYKNEANQIVGHKEIIDPLGNSTVIIQDALGRNVTT